jgi:hypothetical protein
MMITEDRLDAFIEAYERAHGERLNRDEAMDAALRVLAFVKLLSTEPGTRLVQVNQPPN